MLSSFLVGCIVLEALPALGIVFDVKETLTTLGSGNLNWTKTEDVPAGDTGFLWDGVDLPDQRLLDIGLNYVRSVNDMKDLNTAGRVNVQVTGLQNAGTDLMNALLHLNFGSHLTFYGREKGEKNGLWRYGNLKEAWRSHKEQILDMKKDDVHLIAVIRNPLTWLQWMRTKPEELEQCTTGGEWLSKECVHPGPTGERDRTSYPNIASIWNQWYDGFQNAPMFGFNKRLIVQYEMIVRNPKAALGQIARFLGLKEPQRFAMPSGPGNRNTALRLIEQNIEQERFTETEKVHACDHLDADLQQLYDYHDCVNVATANALPADRNIFQTTRQRNIPNMLRHVDSEPADVNTMVIPGLTAPR